jgi:hypothetical protein
MCTFNETGVHYGLLRGWGRPLGGSRCVKTYFEISFVLDKDGEGVQSRGM